VERERERERRLGGHESLSGHGGEEKEFLHCLCRESNPGRPARSLVTDADCATPASMMKLACVITGRRPFIFCP